MVPFGNFGWDWFGFGWILVIVSVILVAFGIVRLVKSFSRESDGDVCEEAPLDSLERRYARGEISREEFEIKKSDIQSSHKESSHKRAA